MGPGSTTSGSRGHFAILTHGTRPTPGEDKACVEGPMPYNYMTHWKSSRLRTDCGKNDTYVVSLIKF